MRTGHTPSRSEAEYWEDCEIPWFTLADVWQLREGRVYLGETKEQISRAGLANSSAELLPAGTVVLSRTASVGFSGIMPISMATTQDFWNWIPRSNLLSEYLLYVFRAMTQVFERATMGSTHKTIYQPDAARLCISLPPLVEQRVIVAFLQGQTAKIDTLVAKKRVLIEKLAEKRSALISRSVTRGLPPDVARAAGLEPHSKFNPSSITWLTEVPQLWRIDRLRRACLRVTDGAHISPDLSSPDFPFVSTVDIANGIIDVRGSLRTSTECYEYLVHNGCKPHRGDVLFSKDGTVGRTAVVDFDLDFVVASSLVVISPDPTHLESRFLNYWLNNSLLQQETLLQLSGAALRRISVEKVSRLPLALPPLPEQRAIADFLDRETAKIDALTAKVEAAIERLQEYRAALITAAVTGKIDVRGAVPPFTGSTPSETGATPPA
jgi:type I restriction enzyme S subunit